jgi:hypothetical protein
MRHGPSGSPGDIVNDATVRIRTCRSLEELERVYPILVRTLEFTARRVEWIGRKGGSSPGVHGPCKWLDQVVRELPALDSAQGEPIRAELRALVARIQERA